MVSNPWGSSKFSFESVMKHAMERMLSVLGVRPVIYGVQTRISMSIPKANINQCTL